MSEPCLRQTRRLPAVRGAARIIDIHADPAILPDQWPTRSCASKTYAGHEENNMGPFHRRAILVARGAILVARGAILVALGAIFVAIGALLVSGTATAQDYPSH